MEVVEKADTETVLLRPWLETITPVPRYGYDILATRVNVKATTFAIYHTNTTRYGLLEYRIRNLRNTEWTDVGVV